MNIQLFNNFCSWCSFREEKSPVMKTAFLDPSSSGAGEIMRSRRQSLSSRSAGLLDSETVCCTVKQDFIAVESYRDDDLFISVTFTLSCKVICQDCAVSHVWLTSAAPCCTALRCRTCWDCVSVCFIIAFVLL